MQAFPRNDVEALAMLYVSSQDLTNVTPEALVKMYDNACKDIQAVRDAQFEAEFGRDEWLRLTATHTAHGCNPCAVLPFFHFFENNIVC